MNKDKPNLRLEIEKLVPGGYGLARGPDGRVVLVEGALPGEEVLAGIYQEKRNYCKADCVEVLQASPHRAEPACSAQGRCGGCDFMHLNYQAQVEAKCAWLDESLAGLAGAPKPVSVASPRPLAYRNRLRMQMENGRLGFFGRRGHNQEPVSACAVAVPGLNRVISSLDGLLGQDGFRGRGWLEFLAGDSGPVFITAGLAGNRAQFKAWRPVLDRMAKDAGATGLSYSVRGNGPPSAGPESGVICYDGQPATMAFPGLFCQVNFSLNRLLVDKVCELAGEGRGRRALDLFSGSGNFGLPLAARGWRVLGVESQPLAGRAARWQAGVGGLEDRHRHMRCDAGEALKRLTRENRRFDLVALDPPRNGAKGLMAPLAELEPEKVIYVSCHPAALARDAKALAELGYAPAWLGMFDMFPQTSHMEALLVMERTKV